MMVAFLCHDQYSSRIDSALLSRNHLEKNCKTFYFKYEIVILAKEAKILLLFLCLDFRNVAVKFVTRTMTLPILYSTKLEIGLKILIV